MQIKFLGVGSAFTLPSAEEDGTYDINKCDWQSNAMVVADSGKKLLIDCGSDIRFSLLQQGITPADYGKEIDAIYVSHLHADHIGGMEPMGFCTFFNPNAGRPKLYANGKVMEQMWDEALQAGLASVQGRMMTHPKTISILSFHNHQTMSICSMKQYHCLCILFYSYPCSIISSEVVSFIQTRSTTSLSLIHI